MPTVLGQFDLDLATAFTKGTGPTASDRLHRDEVPTEGARDRSDDPVQLCREDCLLQRASQVTSLDPSKVSAPAATAFVKGGIGGELRQGCGAIDDVDHGARRLGPLAYHGGPTETMLPLSGNPAIGVIPYQTTVTLDHRSIRLCPAASQQGTPHGSRRHCNAGAAQSLA
jgi:hypothetical protein